MTMYVLLVAWFCFAHTSLSVSPELIVGTNCTSKLICHNKKEFSECIEIGNGSVIIGKRQYCSEGLVCQDNSETGCIELDAAKSIFTNTVIEVENKTNISTETFYTLSTTETPFPVGINAYNISVHNYVSNKPETPTYNFLDTSHALFLRTNSENSFSNTEDFHAVLKNIDESKKGKNNQNNGNQSKPPTRQFTSWIMNTTHDTTVTKTTPLDTRKHSTANYKKYKYNENQIYQENVSSTFYTDSTDITSVFYNDVTKYDRENNAENNPEPISEPITLNPQSTDTTSYNSNANLISIDENNDTSIENSEFSDLSTVSSIKRYMSVTDNVFSRENVNEPISNSIYSSSTTNVINVTIGEDLRELTKSPNTFDKFTNDKSESTTNRIHDNQNSFQNNSSPFSVIENNVNLTINYEEKDFGEEDSLNILTTNYLEYTNSENLYPYNQEKHLYENNTWSKSSFQPETSRTDSSISTKAKNNTQLPITFASTLEIRQYDSHTTAESKESISDLDEDNTISKFQFYNTYTDLKDAQGKIMNLIDVKNELSIINEDITTNLFLNSEKQTHITNIVTLDTRNNFEDDNNLQTTTSINSYIFDKLKTEYNSTEYLRRTTTDKVDLKSMDIRNNFEYDNNLHPTISTNIFHKVNNEYESNEYLRNNLEEANQEDEIKKNFGSFTRITKENSMLAVDKNVITQNSMVTNQDERHTSRENVYDNNLNGFKSLEYITESSNPYTALSENNVQLNTNRNSNAMLNESNEDEVLGDFAKKSEPWEYDFQMKTESYEYVTNSDNVPTVSKVDNDHINYTHTKGPYVYTTPFLNTQNQSHTLKYTQNIFEWHNNSLLITTLSNAFVFEKLNSEYETNKYLKVNLEVTNQTDEIKNDYRNIIETTKDNGELTTDKTIRVAYNNTNTTSVIEENLVKSQDQQHPSRFLDVSVYSANSTENHSSIFTTKATTMPINYGRLESSVDQVQNNIINFSHINDGTSSNYRHDNNIDFERNIYLDQNHSIFNNSIKTPSYDFQKHDEISSYINYTLPNNTLTTHAKIGELCKQNCNSLSAIGEKNVINLILEHDNLPEGSGINQLITKSSIDSDSLRNNSEIILNGSLLTVIPQFETIIYNNFNKSPTNFICESVGKFPNPENCSMYHLCVNMHTKIINIPVECPNGMLYHPEIEGCTRRPVQCKENLGLSCTKSGVFAHPTDCNRYYKCFWRSLHKKFVLWQFKCPSRMKYDVEQKICINGTTLPLCDNSSETRVESPLNCVEVGRFPVEYNCIDYYECKEKKGVYQTKLKTCSEGKLFDRELGRCRKKDVVFCPYDYNYDVDDFKDSNEENYRL